MNSYFQLNMLIFIIYISVVTGRDDASESKILVETPMVWASAQYYCRQRHTDLLSVRNLDENQEIQVMVPQGKLVWIGLFGDSWKWSDGSSYVFRSWGQGQPDSLGEGPNCAHVHDKTWSIKSCDTKSIFLCYCKYYTSSCKPHILNNTAICIHWAKTC